MFQANEVLDFYFNFGDCKMLGGRKNGALQFKIVSGKEKHSFIIKVIFNYTYSMLPQNFPFQEIV